MVLPLTSEAHIFRRTFATRRHEEGWQTEEIAAYLGDTPETVQRHYLCLTQRIVADGQVLNVVKVPKFE